MVQCYFLVATLLHTPKTILLKKNRGGENGDNENLDEGADTKATTYTITINPTRYYIKTTASVQFVASGTISGRCSLGSSIS